MRRTAVWLAGLGGILLAFTTYALSMDLPRIDTLLTPLQLDVLVGLLAAAGFVYLAAIFVVLRLPPARFSMWIILGVAVLMRAPLIFHLPVLSSDVYRYVWDGQVQAAGINPYRYVPNDPALTSLRDPKVFPFINRAWYARTIYPPAAQVIFATVGRITSTVAGMKMAMVFFEGLAVYCMLHLLRMARLPRERILIYVWNPLTQWSFAFDGHIDAAAIGLLGLALFLRSRHRHGLAGAVLAAAALVKFLPLVVAPAFVRRGKFWRPALAGLAVILSLYAVYLSAGQNVLGFLPGYRTEEGLDNGSGIWLLAGLSHLFSLPSAASSVYLVAAAIGLGGLSIWMVRGRFPDKENEIVSLCRDVAVLAACAMVVISPHYPWYFAWLALPAVIAPMPSVIWLSVAPVILYISPWHERFYWASLIYVPAIALAAFETWRSQARRVTEFNLLEAHRCRLQSP